MEEREELQLGALLHDIGKVLRRTDSVKLTAEDRKSESECCPLHDDGYSHAHVLYTLKFFKRIWPERFFLARDLATFHHCPDACKQSRLVKIVSLADRLASGEPYGPDEETTVGQLRKSRLCCLFSTLRLPETPIGQDTYFPLFSLHTDLREHFPQTQPTMKAGESYDQLWNSLARNLDGLDPNTDFNRFYSQVHQLLERDTLFVPSAAYRGRPDVSLFHHSKATAAIATCLYDAKPEEKELDDLLAALSKTEKKDTLKSQAMWLVGADLSGIQDFIFGVASQRALKGLRGRSVYLQLIAEAMALRILHSFNLPCSNLIYCGGGHFYLLVPHTPDTVPILRSCQEHIDTLLVRAHRGQLALCLAWEPLLFEDFFASDISDEKTSPGPETVASQGFTSAWQRLGLKLARKKREKFSSLLTDQTRLKNVLGPFPLSGDEVACDICGEPIMQPQKETQRCPFCQSFEELAGRVARSPGLRVDVSDPKSVPSGLHSYEEVLDTLGVRFLFLKPGQDDPHLCLFNTIKEAPSGSSWRGFRFLAKHTPFSNGNEIKNLEDFAKDASGIDKWGVLRADVDRLGKVFGEGLQGSDRSISQLTMLSYLLSLYFSTHVETLARQPAYKDKISIIYAGGDDLFAIGSWSMLVSFAQDVYNDFRKFSAGTLSLSAGIFLAPGKGYPIGQAGKLAGEEEHNAKSQGRDRLGTFGQTVPWHEVPGLKAIEEKLADLVIHRKAPRSLFTLLFQAYEAQQQFIRNEITLFPVWRIFYAFRRLVERQKGLAEPLMELERMIIQDLSLPEHGSIAIRWADYLTRQGE